MAAYPSLDAQDRELGALCDAAMVQALASGETLLADYLLEASAWHAAQITERAWQAVGVGRPSPACTCSHSYRHQAPSGCTYPGCGCGYWQDDSEDGT
jgi:hypothetical protein